MSREADEIEKTDISFLTTTSKKPRTKPRSEVHFSRKSLESSEVSKTVQPKTVQENQNLERTSLSDLSRIASHLGERRAFQFYKIRTLADDEGVIEKSTKEIAEYLGIKKQAASNLCSTLLEKEIFIIKREFDAKSQRPRIYRISKNYL